MQWGMWHHHTQELDAPTLFFTTQAISALLGMWLFSFRVSSMGAVQLALCFCLSLFYWPTAQFINLLCTPYTDYSLLHCFFFFLFFFPDPTSEMVILVCIGAVLARCIHFLAGGASSYADFFAQIPWFFSTGWVMVLLLLPFRREKISTQPD
ncbi:MAG: hypothetical protein AAF320_05425 [Myxococcota bacterium]